MFPNFDRVGQSDPTQPKSSNCTSQQIKKSALLQPPAFPMVTLESLAAATSSAAAATVTTSVVSGGSHNEVTVTARNQSGRLQVLAASGTICHPTSSSSSPPALQGNAGLFFDRINGVGHSHLTPWQSEFILLILEGFSFLKS